MTAESITAAFGDYVLSLGPAEERTVADCQGLLGAYELAIRLGGDPEALARVVSPMALGARLAAQRYASAGHGGNGAEIALPEEHG
jgi:hypothetical protein